MNYVLDNKAVMNLWGEMIITFTQELTFRKRGHWFFACGQEDQNQSGSGPALAVDTK